ncbi:MAG: lysophospholipid acyltransferase family protein, partial [Planctomycetes bacterium]|nr:lysophospholipid acyltransferase family protein [Planctomycetota bacterium]
MSDKGVDSNAADTEVRRSAGSSRRRMTAGRRLGYAIGLPLLRAIVWLLNATYRIEKVSGSDIADRIIADTGRAYVPCYWHSQHLVLSWLMRDWIRRGFKACFIVSASVDGEVPARLARKFGAEVIRGSAANTGALVLRDAQSTMERGVSIVTTSDGPVGPAFEFKPGTVLMARIGGAPMVPIGYAADRAWVLDTWDRFMIPKPFARIAIAVGEPIEVPRGASPDDIERL